MESIFHEKQEGSLCAQHCLNALLQGSYFSAVDLAEIARQLDDTEKATMAEAGMDTAEYRQFLNQESTNFDDSGFFSIQVLQAALRVWDQELIPYSSSAEQAKEARKDPRTQQAYICNFKEHWFTIRKLGKQWFNLNSMLKRPELVSDTYLHMYLLQLQQEGYSIFIVIGNLPPCEADQILNLVPVDPSMSRAGTSQSRVLDDSMDSDLQRALEQSRADIDGMDASLKKTLQASNAETDENDMLQQALALSMQCQTPSTNDDAPSTSKVDTPSADEIRRRRLAYLDQQTSNVSQETTDNQKSNT